MEEKKKNAILSEVLDYVKVIIFAVVFVLIVNNFILINALVPSESMEKTIMTGDRIFGFRLAYEFEEPERFDIVIFKYPDDPEQKELYIKRVIGLPGERIQIRDGQILINGETYREGRDLPKISNPGLATNEVYLESDEYFVLGDNRNNSEDSRYADVGNVKKKYIAGKIWFRVTPVKKAGFLK